jgi:hypothetical protein
MKIRKFIIQKNDNTYTAHFTVTKYYFFGLIPIVNTYYIGVFNSVLLKGYISFNIKDKDRYYIIYFFEKKEALENLNKQVDLFIQNNKLCLC